METLKLLISPNSVIVLFSNAKEMKVERVLRI